MTLTPESRGKAFVAALASINETRAGQPPHLGGYIWRNGAEQVWECSDDCPHPIHEEYACPDRPALPSEPKPSSVADRAVSRPSAADLRDAAEGMVQTLHRAGNAIGWEMGGLAAADAKRIRTLAALWPAYEAVVAAADRRLTLLEAEPSPAVADALSKASDELHAAVKALRAARRQYGEGALPSEPKEP